MRLRAGAQTSHSRGAWNSIGLAICLAITLSRAGYAQVSWNAAGPYSSAGRVISLAAHPLDSSIVYLASPGGGIWKTETAGVSWASLMESDAPLLEYCSVEIDRYSPEVVYAGTGNYYSKSRSIQGVVRSPDGGKTWTLLPRFTNWPVCALAIDPANSARVLAGSAEGIFLSTDSGSSWKKVFDAVVTSLVFDGPNTIYAGTAASRQDLVARSTDGGRSWTSLSIPAPSSSPPAPATWVSLTATAGTISLAASRPSATLDFYRSADSGNSWWAALDVGPAEPPVKLISSPLNGRLYIAGKTLMGSADEGVTWSAFSTASGGFHSAVFSDDSLLLGGDQGLEFGLAPRFVKQPPIANLKGVSFNSASWSEVWAAGDAGLFRLSLLPATPEVRVSAVSAAGTIAVGGGNSPVLAAAGGLQVFTSLDSGATFTAVAVIPGSEPHASFPPLVVDPVSGSSIFVAGSNLYHSTNSGATWTMLSRIDPDPSHVVIALAMAPAARTTLYAATACLSEIAAGSCPEVSFIWRSANSGNTWVQQTSVEGLVGRLAIDPRQSNTVYATIRGLSGDLLRSTNGGVLWTSILANLPGSSVNDIVIDPSSLPAQTNLAAQTVYVGTDAGVFASFDSGTRWTDISVASGTSLPKSPVTGLALRTADVLLAATEGRGAFWTSVAGLGGGIVANSLSLEVALMKGTVLNTGLSLFNVSTTAALDWKLEALDSWISVDSAEGLLRQRASTEVPIRVSGVGLPVGTHLGRLRLTTGTLQQTIKVIAHISPEAAGISVVDSDAILGRAGSAVPIEVLVVDAEGNPLADVPVFFAIASGGGSVTPRAPSTNRVGIARTVLTLPAAPGPVTIVATTGNLSVTISAAAIPAPSIRTDSVVDGVTYNLYTPLAPGSIISISGDNLAAGSIVATGSPLPTVLASTRVYLSAAAGELVLPLISVTPGQVLALVPVDFPTGSYTLRVDVGLSPSNGIPIFIAAVSPGIFTLNGSGRGPGLFFKSDGSQVTAANPAIRGSVVTFYADGLGTVSPSVAPGQAGRTAEPLNRTTATPRVVFDFSTAALVYSGLAPGAAGRYQVTVVVPTALTPSNGISVSLIIGGVGSNRVTIPVR